MMRAGWVWLAAAILAACAGPSAARVPATGLSGTLLLIGGGLDDDNRPVFERFAALASAKGPARIVIATAASGDQGAAAQGREQALATWCPQARIDVITRETPATDAAALIDRATAMFFTGGDQKRITERYRKDGQDGDEVRAMRRLLARGGVIAGTSAGDAMMGDRMMLSGRSPAALGVAPAATADEEEPVSSRREPRLGPQVGPGMGFVPWVLTDSHFFERDRVGRLVAALEATGTRLGLGVGEDACVEIDLATGDVIGTTVAESLLVDAGAVHRDGHTRRGVRARLLAQGTRVSLIALLAKPPAPMPALPPPVQVMPIAEPGQHRQLASWRLFTRASKPDGGAWRLQLDGWSILAWPAGDGEVCFAVGPDA